MKTTQLSLICGLGAMMFSTAPVQAATVVLYDQNFENPVGFVNDGGDVNIYQSVNQLYGNQPNGFTFAQNYTVETLLITGNKAFRTGYSDPSGIGGNYALGMLSSGNNDLLGLSFNIGSKKFLNTRIDLSSIDLSVFGGPFVSPGTVPTFEFALYDNPSGATGLGSGTLLDKFQISGKASPRTVFDWTEALFALDATGNTNGNVTLQIDLLEGGYAALDNFRIAASDTPGDVGNGTTVPEPASVLSLLALGTLGAGYGTRRKSKSND